MHSWIDGSFIYTLERLILLHEREKLSDKTCFSPQHLLIVSSDSQNTAADACRQNTPISEKYHKIARNRLQIETDTFPLSGLIGLLTYYHNCA